MNSSEIFLTTTEVMEYENLKYDTIKKQIKRNKFNVVKVSANNGYGFEYRISLDQLTKKAQQRYYAQQKNIAISESKEEQYKNMTIEVLTDKQRAEIEFWKKVIRSWQAFINEYPKQRTEKTNEFVKMWNITNPDKKISARTLNRKFERQKEYGDIGLTDCRLQSHKKGTSIINEVIWDVFLQWYLDEGQPGVKTVYDIVTAWAELEMPELLPLPSEACFYRAVKKLPDAVVKYYRYGNKVCEDECLPYLIRDYENISSNEIWSSDYHTLDVFVKDDITGEVYRPHLVVWFDVRSRKILSASLRKSSDADGVVTAFRKAVEKYGIPEMVYLDNGREFLVSDFGGRGVRKTGEKTKDEYGKTILERCGVVMHNAKVANGRAKAVERCFKTVKITFSKFFSTYTGGRPAERPERMKKVMNKDNIENIPLLSEVTEKIYTYFEGWYNEKPSNAEGLNGNSPNECYINNLLKKRTATREQLNLMLLRTERLQKIKENGVFIKVGDKEIYFRNPEFIKFPKETKVFVRYNPEDLSKVRIYDQNDVFLMEAERWNNGGYSFEADIDSIKQLERAKKQAKKFINSYKKDNLNIPEAKEVIYEKAKENMVNANKDYAAKVIEIVKNEEQQNNYFDKAVGEDTVIDLKRMVENAKKRKGEEYE